MKNSDGKTAEIHTLRPGQPSTRKPPAHLSAAAARLWRQLVAEYSLDDAAGLLLLQTALEAHDRLKSAQRALKRDGATYRDRFGQPRPHPLLTVERDARAGMLAALRQLNLDIEPLRDAPGRPGGR